MKLFIKQQPFSWRNRFWIRDEADRDILSAEGELNILGARLQILDKAGKPVARVEQRPMGWRPRYQIEINGRAAGHVVRRFALVGTRFDYEGPGWSAEGTFGSHDFKVYDHERIVMTVRKAWFTWGDSYELEIQSRDDLMQAVCFLLAIDLSLAADQQGV